MEMKEGRGGDGRLTRLCSDIVPACHDLALSLIEGVLVLCAHELFAFDVPQENKLAWGDGKE